VLEEQRLVSILIKGWGGEEREGKGIANCKYRFAMVVGALHAGAFC
jgi:hypothetical protein